MRDAREALVRTTQTLLWERGYAAMSPRAIQQGAGVGQGSMYHHFAGKEALAVAAFEGTADSLVETVAEVLRGDGGAVARVEAYLLRERDVLRGCPVGRMAADPDVLGSEALRGVLATTFDRIRCLVVEVLADGVRTGELAPGVDPIVLADTVLATVQGGYVLARAAGDPVPFDRAVHGAVALLRLAQAGQR